MDVSETESDDMSDTDSILDELDQLVRQSEIIVQTHQDALESLIHIQSVIDDTISLPYKGALVDLDSILEELHRESLAHLEKTGEITFGSLLMSIL